MVRVLAEGGLGGRLLGREQSARSAQQAEELGAGVALEPLTAVPVRLHTLDEGEVRAQVHERGQVQLTPAGGLFEVSRGEHATFVRRTRAGEAGGGVARGDDEPLEEERDGPIAAAQPTRVHRARRQNHQLARLLHRARDLNRAAIVEYLLERGVDVLGEDPLDHRAVRESGDRPPLQRVLVALALARSSRSPRASVGARRVLRAIRVRAREVAHADSAGELLSLAVCGVMEGYQSHVIRPRLSRQLREHVQRRLPGETVWQCVSEDAHPLRGALGDRGVSIGVGSLRAGQGGGASVVAAAARAHEGATESAGWDERSRLLCPRCKGSHSGLGEVGDSQEGAIRAVRAHQRVQPLPHARRAERDRVSRHAHAAAKLHAHFLMRGLVYAIFV